MQVGPEITVAARTSYAVTGLFAGVGGLEEGFRRAGHETAMLCEYDEAARYVLAQRFKGATLKQDVRRLKTLPAGGILTAGFPCQDLSQVGRRRGIEGPNSGLIDKVLTLLRKAKQPPRWLLLENVPFMLKLDKGHGIRWLTGQLEEMGFNWAYRTIDALAFGLPQRRRRVLLLASLQYDPRPALLGEDHSAPAKCARDGHACGFYWTEGNTGLGWAIDAIPPLKSGSALHIPSPPAIWLPEARAIVTPAIEDAERLQGFPAGWTDVEGYDPKAKRRRWRMVGNAVSVEMSEWIANRLAMSHPVHDTGELVELPEQGGWPSAAWGQPNGPRSRANVSEWPVERPRQHLAAFLEHPTARLSNKAAGGFLKRLVASSLRYEVAFRADLEHHIALHEG
ncbi:DNA (cytosine-5-)-methyltransferase [Inquilinus limosus]|uniref:DNA (cytosine-5-)-methyltransferase n=2 Tax=Inquilinus limosus TaxID=171674 RepID=A0A211ZEJ1_9PROT|nr:DNA (cytosine-5-)-methyltransferase [Inquilinus limosus]